MKFIDDRGKLFGLINPIDLLVLLLVLLVGTGVYYKTQTAGTFVEPSKVKVSVLLSWLRPEEAISIKTGDILVANGNYTDVKITDVKLEPARTVNVTDEGKSILTTDPYRKDVTVIIEGQMPITSPELKFGGQDLRRGKEYFIKSQTYEYRGYPLDIEISK